MWQKAIQFVNNYSLLVFLGTASTAACFNHIYQSQLTWVFPFVLGLVVWALYTIDHMLDGKQNPYFQRHTFNYNNRKFLAPLVVIALVVAACSSLFLLPNQVLLFGLGLGALVFCYYLWVHYFKWAQQKELIVAICVALGCAGIPWFVSALDNSSLIYVFLLGGINQLNLLLFSYFDCSADLQSGKASAFQKLSNKNQSRLIVVCNLLLWGILIAMWWMALPHLVLFIGMILPLQLLVFYPRYFAKGNRFRFYGDLIYIFPLIYLIIAF